MLFWYGMLLGAVFGVLTGIVLMAIIIGGSEGDRHGDD